MADIGDRRSGLEKTPAVHAGASFAVSTPNRSARSSALRRGIHGIERLARGHEQAVALGAAEGDVAAYFGQPDPADQFSIRRPYRDAAIADVAAGIAGSPEIAVDVAAHSVRSAFDAVHHEVAEPLLVRELVVGADIEHEYVALAAGAGVAGSLAGADHIQFLVIGREAEPVGIGHLVLGHHEVDAAGWIDAIAVGRQFAFARHKTGRLADPRIEFSARIGGASGTVRLAFIELAAIGRVGEPVAAIGVGDDIVGRVELLAAKIVGEHDRRAV